MTIAEFHQNNFFKTTSSALNPLGNEISSPSQEEIHQIATEPLFLSEESLSQQGEVTFRLIDLVRGVSSGGNPIAQSKISEQIARQWLNNSMKASGALLEAVMNAHDTHAEKYFPDKGVSLGRFGEGCNAFFSLTHYPKSVGSKITYRTTYKLDNQELYTYQATIFVNKADGQLMVSLQQCTSDEETGTVITVKPCAPDQSFPKELLEEALKDISRLSLYPYGRTLVNDSERVVSLGFGAHSDPSVQVELKMDILKIEDQGFGIPLETFLRYVLIPNQTTKNVSALRAKVDVEISNERHPFLLPKIMNFDRNADDNSSSLYITVGGMIHMRIPLPKPYTIGNSNDVLDLELPLFSGARQTANRKSICFVDENSLESRYVTKLIKHTIDQTLQNSSLEGFHAINMLYEGLLAWENHENMQHLGNVFSKTLKKFLQQQLDNNHRLIPVPPERLDFWNNLLGSDPFTSVPLNKELVQDGWIFSIESLVKSPSIRPDQDRVRLILEPESKIQLQTALCDSLYILLLQKALKDPFLMKSCIRHFHSTNPTEQLISSNTMELPHSRDKSYAKLSRNEFFVLYRHSEIQTNLHSMIGNVHYRFLHKRIEEAKDNLIKRLLETKKQFTKGQISIDQLPNQLEIYEGIFIKEIDRITSEVSEHYYDTDGIHSELFNQILSGWFEPKIDSIKNRVISQLITPFRYKYSELTSDYKNSEPQSERSESTASLDAIEHILQEQPQIRLVLSALGTMAESLIGGPSSSYVFEYNHRRGYFTPCDKKIYLNLYHLNFATQLELLQAFVTGKTIHTLQGCKDLVSIIPKNEGILVHELQHYVDSFSKEAYAVGGHADGMDAKGNCVSFPERACSWYEKKIFQGVISDTRKIVKDKLEELKLLSYFSESTSEEGKHHGPRVEVLIKLINNVEQSDLGKVKLAKLFGIYEDLT